MATAQIHHTAARPALPASPTKLRDGSWGARVRGQAHPGDEIQITTRAGKSWTAHVDRVLWTGEGVSIVSTQARQRTAPARTRVSTSTPSTPRRRRGSYICDECGERVRPGTSCWETGFTH